MHFELSARPDVLVGLRVALRESAMMTAVEASLRDNVILVVSELASNAVAASLRSFEMGIDVDQVGHGFEIIVTNRGHAHFDHATTSPASPTAPPPTQLRGRGLAIVGFLADSLTLTEQQGLTIARATVSAPCETADADPDAGSPTLTLHEPT